MTSDIRTQLTDREYLGDGAYVGREGNRVWLTTEDGLSVTNEICLEPEVVLAFIRWLNGLRGCMNQRGSIDHPILAGLATGVAMAAWVCAVYAVVSFFTDHSPLAMIRDALALVMIP